MPGAIGADHKTDVTELRPALEYDMDEKRRVTITRRAGKSEWAWEDQR